MDVTQRGTGEAVAFDFVLNVQQDPGGGPPPPGTSWVAGHAYNAGDTVTYSGATYACLQAHTSQTG
ncbi:chitodextrinase [Catenulispora sp. GAS73]|uniref:carbohydrate-binding protein n=1 Tax=Catenulispora sp. GAS73 TaxID=3156269 RepID=UPI003513CBD3